MERLADVHAAPTSSARASSMSSTHSCRPEGAGAICWLFFRSAIEQAEPGGVAADPEVVAGAVVDVEAKPALSM